MSARKPPEERQNRIRPVYEEMSITWDGKTRGKPLPKGYDWCQMTVNWWSVIRKSAQAMSFHETDWQFLMETARLHNRFWNPNGREGANSLSQLAAELRIRLERYGFTWADRRKYGIHISTPEEAVREAEQITRTPAIDYRRRLNGLD